MSTAHMKILDPATGKFVLWDGQFRQAPAAAAESQESTDDSDDGSK